MYWEKLREIINQNQYIIDDMKIVRSLVISNAYIAAGYVRNLVWDLLHGYQVRTDPLNQNEETEKKLEQNLISHFNRYKWSVKNQARMHVLKNDNPYYSVEDAMKRWPETATAVGIRLDEQDNIKIVAPHGLEDLFELKIRKSAYFMDRDYFFKRIENKEWLRKWPLIKIVE